jgi:hypothetical protein
MKKHTKKITYPPLLVGDLLTEPEAAAILRLKAETLRAWRTNRRCVGKGPAFIQQGQGRVLYHRADLAEWAAAHRYQAAPQ